MLLKNVDGLIADDVKASICIVAIAIIRKRTSDEFIVVLLTRQICFYWCSAFLMYYSHFALTFADTIQPIQYVTIQVRDKENQSFFWEKLRKTSKIRSCIFFVSVFFVILMVLSDFFHHSECCRPSILHLSFLLWQLTRRAGDSVKHTTHKSHKVPIMRR